MIALNGTVISVEELIGTANVIPGEGGGSDVEEYDGEVVIS